MKINYTLLFLLTMMFNTASAQQWLWGDVGVSGLKESVFAKNVASNKTGHVYFGGSFQGALTFGSYTLSTGWKNVFLTKIDSNGNVLWAVQSQSDSSANCFSVATDDSDYVFITGVTGKQTQFGSYTLPEAGAIFLVKYNANGNVLWASEVDTTLSMGIYKNGFNTTSVSPGGSVALDRFGNEFVTGVGAPLFKFDRNGKLLWHLPQTMHLSHSGFPNAGSCVATDSAGNVYLSGIFTDSIQFGNIWLYSANPGIFIAKFDSSGNLLWVHQSTNNPSTNTDFVGGYSNYPIAVDKATGAVYLGGTYNSPITMGTYTFTLTNSIDYNFFIIKYNADGNMAWAKTANPLQGSTNGGWGIFSMNADAQNHIFISGAEGLQDLGGALTSAFAFSGDTVSIASSGGDNSSFVLKLDSAGNGLCGTGIPGGGWEANAIGADATGKFVYLGGEFFSTLTFGSDNFTAKTGGGSLYIARWKPCIECDAPVTTLVPPLETVCSGNSTGIKASGAATYTWSPSLGLNNTTGDSVIATPTATTTYTIIGTGSCNADTVQTIVNVVLSPNKPTFTQHDDTLISSSLHDNQWYHNNTLLNDTSRYLVVDSLGWYWVVVNNEANGCSTTSDSMDITSLTGVKQLTVESGQLTVYPNPASNQLIVESGELMVNEIMISNVLGQVVYKNSFAGPHTNTNSNLTIDVSSLPDGLYFITVNTDTGTTTEKFVVSR